MTGHEVDVRGRGWYLNMYTWKQILAGHDGYNFNHTNVWTQDCGRVLEWIIQCVTSVVEPLPSTSSQFVTTWHHLNNFTWNREITVPNIVMWGRCLLCLFLWSTVKTLTMWIVQYYLKWMRSLGQLKIAFVCCRTLSEDCQYGVVSVEMTMVMPRRSSCSNCWNLFLLHGGRYPIVLHNFILGNLQQASIAFRTDKLYLPHTPKNVSPENIQWQVGLVNFEAIWIHTHGL